MQPPRTRTPSLDLNDTQTLRALILNTTAALTTILLVRFTTLLIEDSSEGTIPGYVQMLTEPLVWPFSFLPGLGATLAREAMVIDLLIIPAVALFGLLGAGVLTGWRESDRRARRYPTLRD